MTWNQTNLMKLATLIELLAKYTERSSIDPARITNLVSCFGVQLPQEKWRSVQEDAQRIYSRTRQPARTLSVVQTVPILIGITIIGVTLSDPKAGFGMPVYVLAVILAALLLSVVMRRLLIVTLESDAKANSEEYSRIRSVTQELIFYLCEQVRLSHNRPQDFKMKLKRPDYLGITVLHHLSTPNRYITVPSILGAVLAKARRSVKITSPYALDKELLSTIQRIPPGVRVQLLMKRESQGKAVEKILKQVKEAEQAGFEFELARVRGPDNVVIIDQSRILKTKGADWNTLSDVTGSEREALTNSF